MTEQRRILYLVNALENDAPTMLTAALARGMYDRGWEVEFVAWSRGGRVPKVLEQTDIPVQVLGPGLMRKILQLCIIARRFQPVIIHTALVRPALGFMISRMVCIRKTFRWVAGDHGVHEWSEKGIIASAGMSAVMPAILNQAEAVVTVSEKSRRDLLKRGISPISTFVIPNGVDVRLYYTRASAEREAFLREHFGEDDGDQIFLIGTAGNLRWIKGHDLLLKAAAVVLEGYPGARLVVWGSGPELETLKSLAMELGISHAVAFPGYDASIWLKLPLLDAYVQPSRVESFGLAAAQAMACGVPVVVSDAGGLPELVRYGEFGQVAPANDAIAIASSLRELIAFPRRRRKLAEKSRLRILQRYTQQGMIDATERLYDQLLASGLQ